MLAQERHARIIAMLEKDRNVKVAYLVKLFNISIETVRRDLEYLEKQGYLKRVYGGAVLEKVETREVNFWVRETKNSEEKIEIGQIAAKYVTEGQAIALDVSTTNTEVARAIKRRIRRLTVITNSLAIVDELRDMPNYTILMVGGIIKGEERCVIGSIAEKFIESLHIDITFASCSGISLHAGITDYGIGEIEVKKKMMECSQQIIVVADSSKFGVVSLFHVSDLEKVSMIITDSKIKDSIKGKYLERGIEIVNT
ncbi:DeoR/GlpR family transcriptional regulator of sugar metabolism [Sporomusaceae bacterium BoRhaA]|uniref:DeoR/GlpR family DNA-binding transcription regulator n=1 Tax=Pelorhabdus rhamnosifermentans TaxID=2772457 RepID=UPI001C0609F7|nr:DeoR/GlpR family DNA-binding transcription regulator [Pelorhabdus rhamnosifermentans]MBU2699997.1 DeoR/GlpR family transcriptional regulator of sugar metabolism [Pelorhabdus rhamnosifermentans]